MEYCKGCYWPIDHNNDIYCSGCGKKLVDFELFPPVEQRVYLIHNTFTLISFSNTGIVPIWIEEIIHDSIDLIELEEKEIKPGERKELFIKPINLDVGDEGYFELRTSIKFEDSNRIIYNYKIKSKPSLSISLNPAIYDDKNNVHLVEKNTDKVNIKVESSDTFYYQGTPTISEGSIKIYNDSKEIISKIDNGVPLLMDLENLKDFQEDEATELEIKLPIGQSLHENIPFYIKRIEYASLIEISKLRKHSCVLTNDNTDGRIQLNKNSKGKKELYLYIQKTSQRDVIIKDIYLNDVLVRNNDVKELTDNEKNWIKLRNRKKYVDKLFSEIQSEQIEIFNMYDKGGEDESENKIELLFDLVGDNLPREIFEDMDENRNILITQKLIIAYNDYESNVIYQEADIKLNCEIIAPVKVPVTIDFGTTNSCLCYVDPYPENPENPIVLAELDETPIEKELKTCVRFREFRDENGTEYEKGEEDVQINEAVYEQVTTAKYQPEVVRSIIYGFKSLLKSSNRYTRTGLLLYDSKGYKRYFEPYEITGIYLKYIAKYFQSNYPYEISEINCTFPAAFSKYAINKLKESFKFGGLEDLNVKTSEPIALILNYILSANLDININEKKYIAVFDCGGGTTDLTIAEYSRDKSEMKKLNFLASDGDNKVGGNYLTYLLAKKLHEKFLEKLKEKDLPFPEKFLMPIEINDPIEKHNYSALWNAAEILKLNKDKKNLDNLMMGESVEIKPNESLINSSDGEIEVEAVTLTKDEFDKTVGTEVEKVFEKLNHMLKQLNRNGRIEKFNEKYVFKWDIGSKITLYKYYNYAHQEEEFKEIFVKNTNEKDPNEISQLFLDDIYTPVFIDRTYVDFIWLTNEKNAEIDYVKDGCIDGIGKRQGKKHAIIIHDKSEIKQKIELEFDYLLFAGNSCKLEYIREVGKDIVKAKEYNWDVNTAKMGVSLGAHKYFLATSAERDIDITGVNMLPYAVGYHYMGKFRKLYDYWQSDSFPKVTSEQIPILERRDCKIKIFENRDVGNDSPNLFNRNASKQPIIGYIEVPQEYIGSNVKFEFWYDPENSNFFYNLHALNESDEDQTILENKPLIEPMR